MHENAACIFCFTKDFNACASQRSFYSNKITFIIVYNYNLQNLIPILLFFIFYLISNLLPSKN